MNINEFKIGKLGLYLEQEIYEINSLRLQYLLV
jgi:hypothetical protein